MGYLFFLIFINDLSNDLSSTAKLVVDDTCLFPVAHGDKQSTKKLNKYLDLILKWAYQWKMSFNPDKPLQAQEIIFSRKSTKVTHSLAKFVNCPVARTHRFIFG